MLCCVSTENGTLFRKVASVIFCDDSVQYDNGLLFFRAVIDCWMHSLVHSVLVDSRKIIWDVPLFCFQALHRYPLGTVCPSLRKPVRHRSSRFSDYDTTLKPSRLQSCSESVAFPRSKEHSLVFSTSASYYCLYNPFLFNCSKNFLLLRRTRRFVTVTTKKSAIRAHPLPFQSLLFLLLVGRD